MLEGGIVFRMATKFLVVGGIDIHSCGGYFANAHCFLCEVGEVVRLRGPMELGVRTDGAVCIFMRSSFMFCRRISSGVRR